MSAPISAGPFTLSIIGGMEIDGKERLGLFLSSDVQKLRGVSAFLGDDVYLSRADIAADLLAALEKYYQWMDLVEGYYRCAPEYDRDLGELRAAIARARGAA